MRLRPEEERLPALAGERSEERGVWRRRSRIERGARGRSRLEQRRVYVCDLERLADDGGEALLRVLSAGELVPVLGRVLVHARLDRLQQRVGIRPLLLRKDGREMESER